MNRKAFLCVLAHPDDEAFFASGTIAKMAQTYDVYIVCATKGEAGEDSFGKTTDLGERRANEMRQSANILGVKEIFFLDFTDGTLSNNLYAEIAAKVKEYVEKLQPEILLSFPPTGNSGHLDHIAISLITLFVFYQAESVKELWQIIISEERAKNLRNYYAQFIYVPPGYKKEDINKVIDLSDVWEKKLRAISVHKSQKKDIDFVLKEMEDYPKEEYIHIIKK